MAHTRQSRPDSGLVAHSKVHEPLQVVLFPLGYRMGQKMQTHIPFGAQLMGQGAVLTAWGKARDLGRMSTPQHQPQPSAPLPKKVEDMIER